MAVDRDIEEEQGILDRAYRGLAAMRHDAESMLESVLDLGRGGTFQSRTERDIVVRTSLARLAKLDIGDQALCFGRIDRLSEADGEGGGAASGEGGGERIEAFHIGRLAVSTETHEPLIVDWRAPIAEPFYRATGLDPQGLVRRRHLAVKGRTVVGLEDEYFARPGGRLPAVAAARGTGTGPRSESPGEPGEPGELLEPGGPSGRSGLLAEGLALGGPGALLATLGQARTGHMGDIVGTIQREQDEIIRAPLAGVLMVQGGPGTGKTAVALHRAAYLLYTHRFPLERQGVLVVGPNPLFLRYIEQVLPSLGETGVTLSTVSGLVPEVRVRGVDPPGVARLKGEVRMARVITRAVRTRQRPLRRDVTVPYGATTLRLTTTESAVIVAQARRRSGTHNARRRFVEQQVVRVLSDQYQRFHRDMLGAPADDGWVEGEPGGEDQGAEARTSAAGEIDLEELGRRLRRAPEVAEALQRMWPRLSPQELLHDLLGARPLLAVAGRGILTPSEQSSLYRPRSRSLDEVPWTAADAALVDEARTVLGPRSARQLRSRTGDRDRLALAREEVGYWPAGLDPSPMPAGGRRDGSRSYGDAGEEGARSYGHIVVDEVQDLSPLQLRMVARRSLSGSMTTVGDIAQATGPWAPSGWGEVAEHLAPRREPRLAELTVSYRTPAEVMEVASRVLAVAAPDIKPPRPVRRSGVQPELTSTSPDDLLHRVAEAAESETAAVAPGRTAVLVPLLLFDAVARGLAERGIRAVDPRDPGGEGLSAPLVLLPARESNGLEFDSVVVVEPALIAMGDEGRRSGGGAAVGEVPAISTTRGLRTLYVALTRPTRRLVVVSSMPLPEGLFLG